MNDFIKMSKYAGMREDLVQAGGGNSSYKEATGKMYIKASGFQLADVSETEGYAVVDSEMLKDFFLTYSDLDSLTERESKEILTKAFMKGGRPSIETFLHVISGRYTLHTHPIVVNALACRKDGMETLRKLFPEALSVSYATPGVELAKAYFKEYKKAILKEDKEFNIVFLQNHGLVVSGDKAEEVIHLTEKVVTVIENYLQADMKGYHNVTRLWSLFPEKVVWKVSDENVLVLYRKEGMVWRHDFCPDCVVFLGKRFLKYSDESELDDFVRLNGNPVIVAYENQMYIISESVKKALEIQSVLSFSAQVMKYNMNLNCSFLSEKEKDYLLDWDAEKYRKQAK